MELKNHYDVVVIGAGAAGLMSAITCAEDGLRVILLDGQPKVGAKILMSGGTRCNVTNKIVQSHDYNSEHIRRVRNILSIFPSTKTISFFESLGVELVQEADGKFFPTTQSGKTVLNAFVHKIEESGILLKTSAKVKSIIKTEQGFIVQGESFEYSATTVIVCTGGLSYPTTGSDGSGYGLATDFGHTLVSTAPALTPFLSDDDEWKSLSGVALPCALTLYADGEKKVVFESPFLFTHFGFSGTCALNMSRHYLYWRDKASKVVVAANFVPDQSLPAINAIFMEQSKKHPNSLVKSFWTPFWPQRFVHVLFKKIGIPSDIAFNQITKHQRTELLLNATQYTLPVSGVFGYAKAEVTSGGINLTEVNDQTMESLKQPGIFFAGEILDCDGRIGGFNFQWAWATGFAAGKGAVKRVRGCV